MITRIQFWRAAHAALVILISLMLVPASDASEAQQTPQIDAGASPAMIPPQPLLSASPRVIQPIAGKLPVSMTIAVLERDCDPSGRPTIDLSKDYLTITGAGLSLPTKDKQKASPCAIQAILTIDPNTPPGSYSIIIDDGNDAPVDQTEISVTGANAGAIPPGIGPETDVIWGVMSQNDCSDAFGKRVAGSLYCIQLKIGNNSGYSLQIAGVGFAKRLNVLDNLKIPSVTIANNSYASTRAVLVRSEAISARNLTYNFLVGAGLIMAASTPFFFGTGMGALNAKTRFLTINSIVNGPLEEGFNVLFPDPILGQLQNLDNESFRDNMVIPNNSQVQTVVFVEKQNVTMALKELQIEIQQNLDAGTEKLKAEVKDNAKAQQQKAVNDALGALAGQAEDTAQNSTRKKVPGLGDIFTLKWTLPGADPLLVKLALGDLVIIGDHIKYLVGFKFRATPRAPHRSASRLRLRHSRLPPGVPLLSSLRRRLQMIRAARELIGLFRRIAPAGR